MEHISRLSIWILYLAIALIIFFAFILLIIHILTKPSNNRDWNNDQNILATAEIKDNLISIRNIRNFSYTSATEFTAAYYDKTFDLNKLTKAWYIVEPFSGIPGSAHTFMSFEFEDNNYISISIEIRKEKGESFHPIKGLFNQFELMYVIADENDVIKLRSNFRKDPVYMYPIKASKEKVQQLFLDMINRANALNDQPEFYNTITNNCTINITRHVNTISPKRVPFFSLKFILPANSDELAYDLGLIDTELSFENARKKFLINDRSIKYANDPNYSQRIRVVE